MNKTPKNSVTNLTPPATIVWFRRDLRLPDNPALVAAAARGGPILPVFIWAPEEETPWAPGEASRWWLHHSLEQLGKDLEKRGLRLILRAGPSLDELQKLAQETGADAVFWNRRYEPAVIRRDAGIKKTLQADHLHAKSFNASLLFEPNQVETKQGGPYKVFTPFWNTCRHLDEPPEPDPVPRGMKPPAAWPRSLPLMDFDLLPQIDWAGGLCASWTPGVKGAQRELERFSEQALDRYDDHRDRPDLNGTSRLSPHLHFGEISPRTIWHAVRTEVGMESRRGLVKGSDVYLKQIGWREFACHLLFHFPHTPTKPLRPEFSNFPWKKSRTALTAWQKGKTGYPIVDAGMRQLWKTGWMHNRVRMITASFLVKDLMIPWQEGATWFWDTLVDADLSNNTLGWQWVAGCGADAAPYFRIFNPTTQGQKFDPEAHYLREWVPEIAALPDKWIHQPWMAPPDVLQAAGIQLGKDYPKRIVDHSEARDRALEGYTEMREQKHL
jgi:deoxyribodipyrimidine photo-lyase